MKYFFVVIICLLMSGCILDWVKNDRQKDNNSSQVSDSNDTNKTDDNETIFTENNESNVTDDNETIIIDNNQSNVTDDNTSVIDDNLTNDDNNDTITADINETNETNQINEPQEIYSLYVELGKLGYDVNPSQSQIKINNFIFDINYTVSLPSSRKIGIRQNLEQNFYASKTIYNYAYSLEKYVAVVSDNTPIQEIIDEQNALEELAVIMSMTQTRLDFENSQMYYQTPTNVEECLANREDVYRLNFYSVNFSEIGFFNVTCNVQNGSVSDIQDSTSINLQDNLSFYIGLTDDKDVFYINETQTCLGLIDASAPAPPTPVCVIDDL